MASLLPGGASVAVTSDQNALAEEVAAIFRGERLEDPWPIWTRLLEEAPVIEAGPMFVVSRFEDVKSMVADRVNYSQKLWITGSRAEAIVASFSPEGQRKWRELAAIDSNMMTRMDDAEHDRVRAIAHRYFTPRRIRDLEPALQGFVDELLAEAREGDTFDFRHFAQELPLRVMLHMIGSPQVDGPFIMDATFKIGRYLGTDKEDVVHDAHAARLEFNQYIEDVILAQHRKNPDVNEFVATLMNAEGQENLTAMEVTMMISVILFAGIETTAVLLSSGLHELLEHRDQWELLCNDPSLAGDAVEELLRWVSPAQWIPRVARHDLELHGVRIPEGYTVMGAVAAAHRDARAYDDPHALNVASGGRPHVALGFGPKFCLGASLLRSEARIALETLATRYPKIELAIDTEDLDWSGSNPLLRTFKELPVALGPKSG
jgi:cytochrome P450